MKLFEHPETDTTLERLPELPPGVEVPDDISGLEPPPTRKPIAGGIRWMRWLAAIVLVGAAGVLTAVLLSGGGGDTDQTPVDYMRVYGTDNPTFIEGSEPGTVVILAPERSYMELYGTDNPTFVPEGTGTVVDTGEYMRLYGTDNPDFLPEPSPMELYGTDNPVFVEP